MTKTLPLLEFCFLIKQNSPLGLFQELRHHFSARSAGAKRASEDRVDSSSRLAGLEPLTEPYMKISLIRLFDKQCSPRSVVESKRDFGLGQGIAFKILMELFPIPAFPR